MKVKTFTFSHISQIHIEIKLLEKIQNNKNCDILILPPAFKLKCTTKCSPLINGNRNDFFIPLISEQRLSV